jgi:hypothetical protein
VIFIGFWDMICYKIGESYGVLEFVWWVIGGWLFGLCYDGIIIIEVFIYFICHKIGINLVYDIIINKERNNISSDPNT